MKLGIFAKTFARPSVEAVFAAVAETGLECVQFNLACVGLPSLLEAPVPAAITRQILRAADQQGIALTAVSGTFNMAHPSADVRQNGVRSLRHLLTWAREAAIPIVTLCTGSRDAQDMWQEHLENHTEAAWNDFIHTLTPTLAAAQAAGITLAVEPEPANVVADAPAARRLLDDFPGAPLKIVLDPANLVVADATAQENGQRLAAAIDLLAPDTVLIHGKDRRADGSVCPAGQGVVDFPAFLGHLSRRRNFSPIIIHGVEETEVATSVDHLRAVVAPFA